MRGRFPAALTQPTAAAPQERSRRGRVTAAAGRARRSRVGAASHSRRCRSAATQRASAGVIARPAPLTMHRNGAIVRISSDKPLSAGPLRPTLTDCKQVAFRRPRHGRRPIRPPSAKALP